jgi:TetR/AcrR family transcriptional regulator, regulator of autoinduction and epiphytic fitness
MAMTQTRQAPVNMDISATTDGRTMRRDRNRTAVITALLDMIREGDLHPGAAGIAERAGVSHRSIFRYFDDLDDLVRTAIDQAFEDAGPLSTIPDQGEGTLAQRIAALVDARIALFDHVDGPMQLARMRAYSIPTIDEEIAKVAEEFRNQIREHFAIELSGRPDAERGSLVDAVLVLTSYDSYAIHTRLLARSAEQMRDSWADALRVLLRT